MNPTLHAMRSSPRFDPAQFDIDAINDTIQRALASAGLDTASGPMKGVTDTIRRALASSAASAGGGFDRPLRGTVIDGVTRVVDRVRRPADGDAAAVQEAPSGPARPGEFVTRSYANRAGARAYKLYVPTSYRASADAVKVPLIVMLHGCTQSPDDFAAGTRMNELAERHGFLVVYPAQAANANGSKCWNWFKPEDQARDDGEPSLIAGITREVIAAHHVDERRVFVAGLSAGAAMAVILGQTYPDLYAGVGAHSGLPYAAAHDMPSAFAAMKAGAGGNGPLAGLANPPGTTPSRRPKQATHHVPTIVFHGDQDATVSLDNGQAIVDQALAGVAAAVASPPRASVQSGRSSGGRDWRRTLHADASGRPLVEQWVLHGAGHAWAGGSANGSYTDGGGPDASAEMIRFFTAQRPAGAA